jgi:hypothetical protein
MNGPFFGIAGLFAGVMLGITATWMQYKSMNIGVDFGNLAVGLGTMAVAWVSFYANKRFLNKESAKSLAQFRVDWVEKLREDIAKFISMAIIIIGEKKAGVTHTSNNVILINEAKARIRLRLQVSKHKQILDCIDSIISAVHDGDFDKFYELIDELNDEAEKLLEQAWSRAKNGLDSEL